MRVKYSLFVVCLSTIIFPNIFATPSLDILMEQTTFEYGEKLFYTIEVSEITGNSAIIHIRDSSGKGSSAIPIQITELKTSVLSPFPFEKEIFPIGKYYIDIEYSGSKDTAEFNLIDSGNIVLPFWTKQIAYSWINEEVSSGSLIDAIQKSADSSKWKVSNEIDKNNIDSIVIPKWVKTTTLWWLEEKISDDDFANAIQYLIKVGSITM